MFDAAAMLVAARSSTAGDHYQGSALNMSAIEPVKKRRFPSKRQATQSDSATMSLSFQIRLASATPHDSTIKLTMRSGQYRHAEEPPASWRNHIVLKAKPDAHIGHPVEAGAARLPCGTPTGDIKDLTGGKAAGREAMNAATLASLACRGPSEFGSSCRQCIPRSSRQAAVIAIKVRYNSR